MESGGRETGWTPTGKQRGRPQRLPHGRPQRCQPQEVQNLGASQGTQHTGEEEQKGRLQGCRADVPQALDVVAKVELSGQALYYGSGGGGMGGGHGVGKRLGLGVGWA